jgi:hypothetical protein
MKKSFFEYLGLADMEKVHSQFLAWVLSDDCNAIKSEGRRCLFENLFGVGEQITQIQTERNNIDIFIQTENHIVVIENKIKSSQHSNQLEKYKEYCTKNFPESEHHFFFLTLIAEYAPDEDWHQLSYSTIYKELNSLELEKNDAHSSIVREYLIFLRRLDEVVNDFNKEAAKYEMVFLDGSKKKQDKKRDDYNGENNENKWFIATNQLETILQKSALICLNSKLELKGTTIGETHGTAILDNIYLQEKISYNKDSFLTKLQVQGSTIKFCFETEIKNHKESKITWRIIDSMNALLLNNPNFGYKRLNKPRKKSGIWDYISISKTMNPPYWNMEPEDFVCYIKKEIENGKELTKTLEAHLKK